MEWSYVPGPVRGDEAEALGVFWREGMESCEGLLAPELEVRCRVLAEREAFTGAKGAHAQGFVEDSRGTRLFLVGLGKPEEARGEDLFRAGAAEVARRAAEKGCVSLGLAAPGASDPVRSRALAEGVVLGTYRFHKYKARDEKDRFRLPDRVLVAGGDEEGCRRGAILGACQNYARDLANEPGNVVTPEAFAREARALARRYDGTCVVLDEGQLAAKGMNALLAVGRGSANPPRLVHLIRRHPEARVRVAVVGKGVTFDSGGLNIKPGDSMRTMKGDKSGACVALGVFRAVCELDLPLELHVVVGAAENMPDGGSFRPDDILRAYNGKTIEVDNTDAEGRLTLADALAYAGEQHPDRLVDLATLTGACVVALGENTAGLFSPDDALAEALAGASRASGERLWRLPMDDERLKKQLKSPVADLVNCGSRWGGAITAALFLEAFVPPGTAWAHLDIAGVDTVKEPFGWSPKGATGFGVRCLASWLETL